MPNIHKPFHQKYRPNNLDELVGQKFISITLKQALLTKKIAPAYLFNGPRGTGKTSSARIFAKSLNCQAFDQPTITPCCKCDLCRQITDGSALDIIEIDADKGFLKVKLSNKELEKRKSMGVKVVLFLIVLTALLYVTMKETWSRIEK